MSGTIYDLIAEAHATRERWRLHMKRHSSPMLVTYRDGAADVQMSASGEAARLEREAVKASHRAQERFQRLFLETNPAALYALPDGPALFEALARVLTRQSPHGPTVTRGGER